MNNVPGELDKRKAYILATVVYEYIATAEPVGSNTLTQKYNLGVSSATIRNEMAELEAAGYLVQPHTSAGRIPSDAGYRTYVDQLMQPEQLAKPERRRIQDELRDASRELEGLIETTTRLLGKLSNNIALVVTPPTEAHAFRHIQLIWLGARTGVAVVMTSMGSASQSMFELQHDVTPDDLTRLSSGLNVRLGGKLLRDITEAEVAAVIAELSQGDDLRNAVVHALRSSRSSETPNITAAGAQNLLDQPEFQDLSKLRSILRIVEEQKSLYDLVADSMSKEQPGVKIGHELGLDDIMECSIVTVPYRFGEHAFGMLAILGPRRMPYGRLMALATGTAETLSERLSDVEIK
ncbi:MAG: heat-inducible transcriptional repressor HrcA [Candidatus Eremiobacteraeota bacterium]|nr:heat-inducible transcriptional repressor HrcA [Candidatus Eremiobacteraeota bacterium]